MTVITGLVYSGKTNYFIQTVANFRSQGFHVLTLKPFEDTLYSRRNVVSHDGRVIESVAVEEPEEILPLLQEHPDVQALAIDGIHRFGWEFLEVAEEVLKRGIHLILSGLDLDFRGQPFGILSHLLCMATQVKKLPASCSVCSAPAHRTQRLVHDRPAKRNDPVFLIGPDVRHEPRCLSHYTLDA